MKKHLKIALASVLMFSAPTLTCFISTTPLPIEVSAMNALQDPNGFADLYWGETLASVQEDHMTKLAGHQSGSTAYHILIPDAHGCVYFEGPVIVRGVFIDNKLCAIIIPFSKEMFPERLKGMSKLFGPPNKKSTDFYAWDGQFSIVLLTKANNRGIVMLTRKEHN